MLVFFELDGQPMAALNGGPNFHSNEAVSLAVNCSTQVEVDHYWDALGAEGDPRAQLCGWLKDRFGVSWQVNPIISQQLLADHTSPRSQAALAAAMKMKKPDIAAMQAAYDSAS
jgi:predicted 3-demethylubiquinone-9 3-methyltransferase (glyoxalase superfamily)